MKKQNCTALLFLRLDLNRRLILVFIMKNRRTVHASRTKKIPQFIFSTSNYYEAHQQPPEIRIICLLAAPGHCCVSCRSVLCRHFCSLLYIYRFIFYSDCSEGSALCSLYILEHLISVPQCLEKRLNRFVMMISF